MMSWWERGRGGGRGRVMWVVRGCWGRRRGVGVGVWGGNLGRGDG